MQSRFLKKSGKISIFEEPTLSIKFYKNIADCLVPTVQVGNLNACGSK